MEEEHRSGVSVACGYMAREDDGVEGYQEGRGPSDMARFRGGSLAGQGPENSWLGPVPLWIG